jgi:hypothetical protein
MLPCSERHAGCRSCCSLCEVRRGRGGGGRGETHIGESRRYCHGQCGACGCGGGGATPVGGWGLRVDSPHSRCQAGRSPTTCGRRPPAAPTIGVGDCVSHACRARTRRGGRRRQRGQQQGERAPGRGAPGHGLRGRALVGVRRRVQRGGGRARVAAAPGLSGGRGRDPAPATRSICGALPPQRGRGIAAKRLRWARRPGGRGAGRGPVAGPGSDTLHGPRDGRAALDRRGRYLRTYRALYTSAPRSGAATRGRPRGPRGRRRGAGRVRGVRVKRNVARWKRV